MTHGNNFAQLQPKLFFLISAFYFLILTLGFEKKKLPFFLPFETEGSQT
jgi:hypothetical protein